MDPKKQIEDATLLDNKGRVRGYLAIGPSGQLVTLPPGTIKLQASLEQGVFVAGLKPGWKLGTPADVKRKEAEAKEADAKAKK